MKMYFIFVLIGCLTNNVESADHTLQKGPLPTYVNSSSGTDNSSCFNEGQANPCKTIKYTLENSPKYCQDNCTVVLATPPSSDSLSIKVTLKDNQSLFVGSHDSQRPLNVSLISIIISGKNVSVLQFQDLTFLNGSLHFENFKQAELNSVTFLGSYNCNRTIKILFSNPSKYNGTVLLHRVKFQDLNEDDITLLDVQGMKVVNITECSFQRLTLWTVLQTSSFKTNVQHCVFRDNNVIAHLVYLTASNGSQSIADSVFVNNSGYSHIFLETSGTNNGMFDVNRNNFQHNTVFETPINDSKILKVHRGILTISITDKHDRNYSVSITDNSFVSNTGSVINVTDPIAGIRYEVRNCTFARNTATSSIMTFSGPKLKNAPYGYSMPMAFNDVVIKENAILFVDQSVTGILFIQYGIVNISNSSFISNHATPLTLLVTQTSFYGHVTFDNNTAKQGGAIHFDRVAMVDGIAKVEFLNNTALLYGGAIYLGKDIDCLNYYGPLCSLEVIFAGNYAHSGIGSNIFSYNSWCQCTNTLIPVCIDNITYDSGPLIVSYPSIITGTGIIETFPGHHLKADITVTDCYNTPSTCVGNVFLGCNGQVSCEYEKDESLQLLGSAQSSLSSRIIEVGLIRSTQSLLSKLPSNEPIKLYFQCNDPPSGVLGDITLSLKECPLAFVYHNNSKQCDLVLGNNTLLQYSQEHGRACIKKGYWYDEVKSSVEQIADTIVASCIRNSKCNFSRDTCDDLLHDKVQYFILPQHPDDQCHDGYGGTLCINCAENMTFTYLATHCIHSGLCKQWHPYIVLMITVIYTLLIGVILVLVIQFPSDVGLGYLHGPLFFLAVLGHLPLEQYSALNSIVQVFTAHFLLRFELFGHIPWCFFTSTNPMNSSYFQLLNPAILFAVLLVAMAVIRCCRWMFHIRHHTPIQIMSIWIIICYWLLARTSVQVMTPLYVNGTKVFLHPDLSYFSDTHVPLWVIALLLLIAITILFVLIFLPSSTFSECFMRRHTKHPCHEFQQCYRKHFHWYSVVYLCAWIILHAVPYYVFQAIITTLTLAHCLTKPYCKKWLNISDTFLLFSLLFISGLLLKEDGDLTTGKVIALYLVTIISLSYITIGTVVVILARISAVRSTAGNIYHDAVTFLHNFTFLKNIKSSRQQSVFFVDEREPHIQDLSEDDDWK